MNKIVDDDDRLLMSVKRHGHYVHSNGQPRVQPAKVRRRRQRCIRDRTNSVPIPRSLHADVARLPKLGGLTGAGSRAIIA